MAVELLFQEAEQPQLRLETWSNAARVIRVIGFTQLAPYERSQTTNSDRSKATSDFDIPGLPLSAQVQAPAGVRRGECYARLTLLMGGKVVKILSSGYVTDGRTLEVGNHEGFTDGPGLIKRITGTNPVAGAEIAETVPTNVRWKILAILLSLTTDATAITRYPVLVLDDGAVQFFKQDAWGNQTASSTQKYLAGPTLAEDAAGSYRSLPLPQGLTLFQAWRILTETGSLQAGDDFAAPILLVEEWIEE